MSKGFINISSSGSGQVSYYLRAGECIGFKHSSELLDKEKIKSAWEYIEKQEKQGDKQLGIRGRHDARVRTNYIMSMPNSLKASDCLARTERVLQQTPIKDCTYTIVVHRGEKDGIKNLHVHVLVNERNLSTMKKDRALNDRHFLDKKLMPLYQAEFKEEFSLGKEVSKRERIEMMYYQSAPEKARAGIQDFEHGEQHAKALAAEQARALAEQRANEVAERQRQEQLAQEAAAKALAAEQARALAEQRANEVAERQRQEQLAQEVAAKALAAEQERALAEQRAKELEESQTQESSIKEPPLEDKEREMRAMFDSFMKSYEAGEKQAEEQKRQEELARQQEQEARAEREAKLAQERSRNRGWDMGM
jgi:hypothetical protein